MEEILMKSLSAVLAGQMEPQEGLDKAKSALEIVKRTVEQEKTRLQTIKQRLGALGRGDVRLIKSAARLTISTNTKRPIRAL